MKRKSVDRRAQDANLAPAMADLDPKPPANSPAKARRDARLAKALRDNLRRRKAPPAAPAPPDPDTLKGD